MNAEQIIADVVRSHGHPDWPEILAASVAHRLREAGIDLDHTYEPIGHVTYAMAGPYASYTEPTAFRRRPLEDQ